MNERKGQDLLIDFLKKNSHLGKWAILGPKMAHPYNSGCAVRMFFFKFCTMNKPIGR